MHKKRFLVAFLVIFPLVVGLACRFTAKEPSPTQTPVVVTAAAPDESVDVATEAVTEPVDTGEIQDLVLLDNSVWSQDGASVFTAFFFQNPNGSVTFEDVEYTVYLYDIDGNEIANDYSSVRWIFPGETIGIVFTFYLEDENLVVDSSDIEWDYDTASSSAGFGNPFTISNAIFWQNNDYPIVTGIINNSDSYTYTDIRANIICYDNAGEIVGGGYSYIDFVPGENYAGFSTYVDIFGSVASIEVFPTFSYSSMQYEGSDFWSKIVILDDYFYSTTYGGISGGFEIQSDIDTVLTDSIAYVTFYDANGNVTSTAESVIDLLLPYQTLGITPWVMTPPAESVTTSYDILILPGDYENDYEFTENPFVVNSTTLTGDWDNYVAVNFTNTYSKQASEVDIFVLLYDADGNIIGGGSDWTTEPIPAGATMEYEVWVDYGDSNEIASIKAWVVPNYWTEYE